jgi:DivIVA domain-containing protein
MALTPEDVVTKQFQHVRFKEGFDPDEVDDFLDEIVVEWRKTIAENEELKAVAELESGVVVAPPAPAEAEPSSRSPPPGGRRRGPGGRAPAAAGGAAASAGIIELAQRLHDEHVAEGQAQRDKLISDAQAQAASILAEAEAKGRDEIARLDASARRSRPASASCASSSATTARSCAASSRRSSATSTSRARPPARPFRRPEPGGGRKRLRPSTAGILIAILAVLVLAVDQFTKYLALRICRSSRPCRSGATCSSCI